MGERKYRPFAFSSLKFLREIERESLQKLKLRQWLILISRALAVTALVLALAGPFLPGKSGALEPGIILIDKSFSTQQDEEFSAMETDLRQAFPRWRVMEYRESSSSDTLREAVKTHIEDYRLSAPHMIVLSDFQDNAMTRNIIALIHDLSIRPVYVPLYKKEPNTAITQLQLFQDPSAGAGVHTLDIQTSAFPEDREIFPLQVRVNGRDIGRAEVSEGGHAVFRFEPEEGREYVRCAVECAPDHYPEDNVRYLVARSFRRIRLLCVAREAHEGYHINAFRAMDRIRPEVIKAEDLPSVDLRDFDAVWISGLFRIPERQRQALLQYAGERPLFLSAGREMPDSSVWHDIHGTLLPEDKSPAFVNISSMDPSLRPETADLKSFRIRRYYRSTAKDLDPLWILSNGDPLLAKKGENLYVWFSPFLFDWNETGLSPYFTAALDRLMQAALQSGETGYHTGDAFSFGAPLFEVITPAGAKHRVQGSFEATASPGFYTILGDDLNREVAVNIPASECEQKRITTDPAYTYPAEEYGIGKLRRTVKGRNLQTIFFLLAAAFMILEMLFLRKGEKTTS